MSEMAIVQIERWLRSKGVTLWQQWDLTQPESLREAAQWFYNQQQQLQDFKAIEHRKNLFPNREHVGPELKWGTLMNNLEFDVV